MAIVKQINVGGTAYDVVPEKNIKKTLDECYSSEDNHDIAGASVAKELGLSMEGIEIYTDTVGVKFTPDGAGLENSWGNYVVPEGFCFLNAVIKDDELLKGKYSGIVTQRYDINTRTVSLYLNWRYEGTWEVLITIAKEKRNK